MSERRTARAGAVPRLEASTASQTEALGPESLNGQRGAHWAPPPSRRKIPGILTLAISLATVGAGAALMYSGFQGVGVEPTFQEAPTVARPFTAEDPDTYTPLVSPAGDPAEVQAAMAATAPLTINIPSVGVAAPVGESGVDANNALILPTSDKTTRYTGAAAIGATEGSTVIAGHVNFSDGSPGALAPIAGIAKGAPVYITDAAGIQHTYTVTTAQTLIKTALPAELFATTGDPQLVLITCGGPIEKDLGGVLGYTHNTVITAVPTTPAP